MPIIASPLRPRRVIARTLAFGASTLLAAGLLVWGPASATGWNQGAAESTLWQLLNGARTNNGMAPLQQHGTLVSLARWRSSDMLARDYFSHTIPGCNCLVYAHYDSNGLQYDWAGENIGWNSGRTDAESPVRVHEQFMASAGHRANILTAAFTHGGVGAAAADGQMYQGYVQDTRMYTELFLQAPAGGGAPPAPPPGGGGGGGGSGGPPAAPAQPTPEPEPVPSEVEVAVPRRPTSASGLDGRATTVVEGAGRYVAARLAADDALGIPGAATRRDANPLASGEMAGPGMEVVAPASVDRGLFAGLVGSLLGFLFG